MLLLLPLRAVESSAPQAQVQASSLNPGIVQTLPLDERHTYVVGISPDLPTTILLPDVPTAFQGVGFTTSPNVAEPCFIDHQPNTNFFSVRPLFPNAMADLNVILNEKIYSFKFFLSDKPIRALTLVKPSKNRARRNTVMTSLSVTRRVQILDMVKSYFVVQSAYPNLNRDIDVVAPGKITDYPGFKVILDQAFSFDADDTTAFRVTFLNETDQPIQYDRKNLAVRVGPNIYEASIADMDGIIPPASPAVLSWAPAMEGQVSLRFPDGSLRDPALAQPLAPGKYVLTLTPKAKTQKPDAIEFEVVALAGIHPVPPPQDFTDKHPAFAKAQLVQATPGQSFGYFAITGNPDGTRANLSLKNEFIPLVSVVSGPAAQTP